MKGLLFIIVFLAFASSVFSFGVGADFLKDDTLLLEDGRMHIYRLYLQNTEDTDVQVKVRVLSAEGLASLDPELELVTIEAGNTNFVVPFNITQPNNAKLGDTFEIEYVVQPQISSGASLAFSPGVARKITVEIVENPSKFYWKNFLLNTGPLWIILILAIGGYVWMSRHEKKK